jgi:hypothetical protein
MAFVEKGTEDYALLMFANVLAKIRKIGMVG